MSLTPEEKRRIREMAKEDAKRGYHRLLNAYLKPKPKSDDQGPELETEAPKLQGADDDMK